jgi:hypothetical protein
LAAGVKRLYLDILVAALLQVYMKENFLNALAFDLVMRAEPQPTLVLKDYLTDSVLPPDRPQNIRVYKLQQCIVFAHPYYQEI